MTDHQKKAGISKAALESWKEGFENALSTWRNASDEAKPKAASTILTFVGSTGAKLQDFVDNPNIGIDEAMATQIREDFARR